MYEFLFIKISLKFVPRGPINNIPALVHIMAWRRPGGKPSSEPMVVSKLTHICVTRPQWVKNTSRPAKTKLAATFCRLNFHIHFVGIVLYVDAKFRWNLSWVSSRQYVSCGSDIGLVPNRRQVIIWTYGDLAYWRIICVTRPRFWVRADSRCAPSQWETSLQSNTVSHWLGVNLESALWVRFTMTRMILQCRNVLLTSIFVFQRQATLKALYCSQRMFIPRIHIHMLNCHVEK